ncbi:cytochrome c oxidase accessory protein CcoG [Kordiimonas sp. SCSIO 12603]|uniref:cytochrome c oxidase accessory protein CcoG n=1 Tax=Kordiimonas sp. SCSIO 12603 TaxID=2829596 RepID=UPI002108565D|nr:cytochrome c oxidase accessory protein CcoG [Kordiimonas sp. SCSIO 12603]UTW59762.1 cytochrome c oxidase accessory protein CcoG [Kordiimonas sp. SCSIO 12603]
MSDTAAPLKLFAKKERVFPKRVWGTFRKIKWVAMVTLLGIYYLAPFLRWDRGEFAPDQAILIDMPARRAYFFFIEIWPQEVYYLTGILIVAAVSLFLVTSLFGRVWCGYACPQTVWTDLFVWVERIVQGDRAKRMKLHKSKWTFEKIWKMALTHSIWLVIGMLTGGAWVFYFNDAPTLLEQIIHLDVPMSVISWVIALTLSTYIMAGFAREQVCEYMCPYARFQSAMFDKDTLIISYDEDRGEKRGKHKKGESWEGRGHCIDCTACVQVCPVGIDIRDGLQMDCIACGLCIDACDDIMDKIDLPRGLIKYDTTTQLEKRREGIHEKLQIFRTRTFYYFGILAVVGSVILYGLLNRAETELHVLHDRNPLFVQLSDGTVRNGYDIKILNKTHADRHFTLSAAGIDGAKIRMQGAGKIEADDLTVFADSVGHFRLFLSAPKPAAKRHEIVFELRDTSGALVETYDSVFISEKP